MHCDVLFSGVFCFIEFFMIPPFKHKATIVASVPIKGLLSQLMIFVLVIACYLVIILRVIFQNCPKYHEPQSDGWYLNTFLIISC